MVCEQPERVWEQSLLLTQVEQAFKELKGDLSLRPIYHQKEGRIEAHIFVAFMAYCLQVTLRQRAREHATGLTARTIVEKFKAVQLVDVDLPTTDGRVIHLSRRTAAGAELKLLMSRLGWQFPAQPPPRISAVNGGAGGRE